MNEMDQLTRFRATVPTSVRPRAEELFHARMQRELDAESPRPGGKSAWPVRTGHRRRIMLIGGTAGVVTTAAAVAVALVTAPSGSPAPAGPAAAQRPAALPTRTAPGHTISPTAKSPLVQLADHIVASPARQPGDATLVTRTTTLPPGNVQTGTATVYDLYTDGGTYYYGRTESELAAQVAGHHTTAGAQFADDLAAARYALLGDLTTARLRMAGMSSDPTRGMSNGEVEVEASVWGVNPAPGQSLREALSRAMIDNYVWVNSQGALAAGAGNAEIRAGVLRVLTTVSGMTFRTATTAGQPTLIVTEATTDPGASGDPGQYQEILTLNARTGIPLKYIARDAGHRPDTSVTYQVSRVTLADVAAGRF
jgi:hypothetical protein